FVCETEGEDRDHLHGAQKQFCPYCPKASAIPLDFTNGPAVISHMAQHLRFDPKILHDPERCGFCLRPNHLCIFFLKKPKGANSTIQIDDKKSGGCLNYGPFGVKRINYAAAAQSTPSSPCSNVPLKCPICPDAAPAVWKYGMKAHLKKHDANLAEYTHLWEISRAEEEALKILWNTRTSRRTPRTANTPSFTISEGHSSRLAIS
ncbi:hypothetical protein SISSUDRAFT_973947, partial [Sistotremastrum suecicum HHB10207 ss-3]